jgi:hypothetical protein
MPGSDSQTPDSATQPVPAPEAEAPVQMNAEAETAVAQPAEFKVHRAPREESKTSPLMLVGVGLLGLTLGGGAHLAWKARTASETAASPPTAAAAKGAPATQEPTERRVFLRQGGLSVVLPKGLHAEPHPAGTNRILRVLKDKKLLLAINSAPVFPWLALENFKPFGKTWNSGPVKVEEVGLDFALEGHWSWNSKDKSLMIMAGGRKALVLVPDWSKPGVVDIVNSYLVVPDEDYRSIMSKLYKLSPEKASGPPDAMAKQALATAIKGLGKEINTRLSPVTLKGVRLALQGKLSHLDTLILGSLLQPALQKMTRDKQGQSSGEAKCPPAASGAHGSGRPPILPPQGPQR